MISTRNQDVDSATHVYLKVDNPQGLQQKYHGPYEIKKRTGETTFEVKTGTFNNGQDRIELHSWNNAKPAYMRAGATVATRPKLGRPSKNLPEPQTHPPPSSSIPSPAACPPSPEAQTLLFVTLQITPCASNQYGSKGSGVW